MNRKIPSLMLGAAVVLSVFCSTAFAADKTINIGVLTDMSSLYSDMGGPGSIAAAQMAIEDSGLTGKGWKINIVSGDPQNKPDVGANIARRWIDEDKVDVIVDVPTSSIVLAVNNLVKDKNAVLLVSGAGASDLTNDKCTPNTIHWTYDTYMTAHGTGAALTKSGDKTWFLLTADHAGGAALQRDATVGVKAAGGSVLGSVKHPFNTSDFSSFLLQAQASKASVIGLTNAGGDTVNSIKQASEFGIVQGGQKLAATLMFISDVHALGLKTAEGLSLISAFYWDLNDGTRAFSKRLQERKKDKAMPTMVQAGVYSSLIHYFKALEKLGENPHDGAKIVAAMKAMPVDDALFGKGKIEMNGRKTHDAYLFEVKSPAESKGPWDYFRLVSTIPANEAFVPLDKSTCPLLRK